MQPEVRFDDGAAAAVVSVVGLATVVGVDAGVVVLGTAASGAGATRGSTWVRHTARPRAPVQRSTTPPLPVDRAPGVAHVWPGSGVAAKAGTAKTGRDNANAVAAAKAGASGRVRRDAGIPEGIEDMMEPFLPHSP